MKLTRWNFWGEDLAPRWHWGFNIFYEQEVGGGRASEIGFSQALSYTLIDEKLSAGIEMNLERSSGPNLDGNPATEFLIGPSFQWRPTPRTHLDLVPLGNVTIAHEDAPDKLTVVQTLPTEPGARTMALDPKTHNIYLASAKFEPAPEPGRRPKIVPGSFKVLVYAIGKAH